MEFPNRTRSLGPHDKYPMALMGRMGQLQWLIAHQGASLRHRHGPVADATRGQGRVLAALKMRDGLSTKELAYLLGMQVSSLNEALAKLAKGGYITREQSPDDRRIMLVNLTEKGHFEPQSETFGGDDIFTSVPAEVREQLLGALDQHIKAASAALGADAYLQEFENRQAQMAERLGVDPDELPFGMGFGGPSGNRGGFRNSFGGRGEHRGSRRNGRGDGRRDTPDDGAFDPRNYGAFDQRSDGTFDPRNDDRFDPRNDGRNDGRNRHSRSGR